MGIGKNKSFWTVEVLEDFLEELTRPQMLKDVDILEGRRRMASTWKQNTEQELTPEAPAQGLCNTH